MSITSCSTHRERPMSRASSSASSMISATSARTFCAVSGPHSWSLFSSCSRDGFHGARNLSLLASIVNSPLELKAVHFSGISVLFTLFLIAEANASPLMPAKAKRVTPAAVSPLKYPALAASLAVRRNPLPEVR